MITIEKVILFLTEEGILKGNKIIPPIRPTHGPCCTCQICGQFHDDCVCCHNEILAKLLVLDN